MELALKGLAEQAGAPAQEIGKRAHDLEKLWDRVRGYVPAQPQDDEIEAFRRLISEWASVDERAEAFRFPTRRSGERHSPTPFQLNLVGVAEMMDRVYTLILGFGMYFDNKRSAR